MNMEKILAQLANAEIARPDVVTRVRTRDLTVVCEFIFRGLPLHLKPKKEKEMDGMNYEHRTSHNVTQLEFSNGWAEELHYTQAPPKDNFNPL